MGATFKISKEVEIKSSIEKIFEFLTNPAKIPLVLPGLVQNINIPKLPLVKGSKFNYKYQMFGFVFEGVWTVTQIKPPTVYHAATTGGIPSKWEYKLSKSKNKTFVKLKIEYETPKTVLDHLKQSIVQRMNDKECDLYLHNLKTVCEMQ